MLTKDSFKTIGIPAWVLDNSQARKMDDRLPLMMFNRSCLNLAVKNQNYILAIALLPSTLLVDSVMNQELSRDERLDCLSICFSLMYIYREFYQIRDKLNLVQRPSKMKGNNQFMSIYDKNTIDKMISLSYSLAKIINYGFPCHLGSCGTHWLEHFFGNIRRISNNNDTPQMFMQSMLTFLYKKLQKGDITEGKVNMRSDSGVYLEEQDPQSLHLKSLCYYISDAIMILIKDIEKIKFETELYNTLQRCLQMCDYRNISPFELIQRYIGDSIPPIYVSSNQSKLTNSSGYSTIKRNVESNQLRIIN